MDRFSQMQAFVEVADRGSISRAADKLGLAKSVVSRRLSELEARLEVQLFQRTTRKLGLTENGRKFYADAQRLLHELEQAECAVSDAQLELKGTLRLALPMSFGLLHLAPAIENFMRDHPQLNLEIELDDRRVDLIAEGFDLAVRIARLNDSSLIARKLAPIRHGVYASAAYLERHGVPRHPQELTSHIGLGYGNLADPQTWTYGEKNGTRKQVRVPLRLIADNGQFLLDCAIAGHGIVLSPTFYSYQAVRRGELIGLLEDFQWPELSAYAIYPRTRHLPARVRALIDFLAARFAGTPYWDRPGPAKTPARKRR